MLEALVGCGLEEQMEHLKSKWTVGTDDDGFKCIVTDEAEPWFVVRGITCLPGDDNGIETLWYICRLHNASLTPT